MLSRYARNECFAISAMAVMLAISCVLFGAAWLMALPLAAGTAALLFYRDPKRTPPKDRNVAVSPADGQISSIHEVAHFEPFGGPAVCVRVFLSIFDVHVNYCPAHAVVHAISRKPGDHISVLNPRSAEVNESVTVVFNHPTHKTPILAVRQIAGLLARTVFCALHEGQVVQRGSKLGIMKLGSTAELYLPVALDQVLVRQGQRVIGAITPLAVLPPKPAADQPPAKHEALARDAGELPCQAVFTTEIARETAGYDAGAVHPKPDDGPQEAELDADNSGNPDLTDHAINHVMSSDDIHCAQDNITAGHDGEFLAARMENAGTDLMLHPAEHGEDNQNLAQSLAGLRPEADTSDDDALLRSTLPLERQPGVETPEDSGDWQVFPPSKKTKKPKADGLLWEEAP